MTKTTRIIIGFLIALLCMTSAYAIYAATSESAKLVRIIDQANAEIEVAAYGQGELHGKNENYRARIEELNKAANALQLEVNKIGNQWKSFEQKKEAAKARKLEAMQKLYKGDF